MRRAIHENLTPALSDLAVHADGYKLLGKRIAVFEDAVVAESDKHVGRHVVWWCHLRLKTRHFLTISTKRREFQEAGRWSRLASGAVQLEMSS